MAALTRPDIIFPQREHESATVWRYISFEKLVSILHTSSLYFTQIRKLGDEFEASMSEAMHRRIGTDVNAMNAWRQLRDRYEGGTIVNCWHAAAQESVAMWRIYATSDAGVAIRTTYAKLRDGFTFPIWPFSEDPAALPAVYIGSVTYADYTVTEFFAENYAIAAMHKRDAFRDEREVRLLMFTSDHICGDEVKVNGGMAVPWNAEASIDSIVVTPFAQDWFFEVVRETVRKFAPELVQRVVRSSLWGRPPV